MRKDWMRRPVSWRAASMASTSSGMGVETARWPFSRPTGKSWWKFGESLGDEGGHLGIELDLCQVRTHAAPGGRDCGALGPLLGGGERHREPPGSSAVRRDCLLLGGPTMRILPVSWLNKRANLDDSVLCRVETAGPIRALITEGPSKIGGSEFC
jgi:hypothetical protein